MRLELRIVGGKAFKWVRSLGTAHVFEIGIWFGNSPKNWIISLASVSADEIEFSERFFRRILFATHSACRNSRNSTKTNRLFREFHCRVLCRLQCYAERNFRYFSTCTRSRRFARGVAGLPKFFSSQEIRPPPDDSTVSAQIVSNWSNLHNKSRESWFLEAVRADSISLAW